MRNNNFSQQPTAFGANITQIMLFHPEAFDINSSTKYQVLVGQKKVWKLQKERFLHNSERNIPKSKKSAYIHEAAIAKMIPSSHITVSKLKLLHSGGRSSLATSSPRSFHPLQNQQVSQLPLLPNTQVKKAGKLHSHRPLPHIEIIYITS